MCGFCSYSQVNQLYIHMYCLCFGFPSHLGHHRALRRAPWLYSRFSLVVYLIHTINSVYMYTYVGPSLPIHPTHHSPPTLVSICLLFVLHICLSTSALQIRSSIPIFFRCHTYALIYSNLKMNGVVLT